MTVGVESRLSLPRGPSVAGGVGRSGRLSEYVFEGPPKQGFDKRGRPVLYRSVSQVLAMQHALYGKGPVTTISSLLIDYPVSSKMWDHPAYGIMKVWLIPLTPIKTRILMGGAFHLWTQVSNQVIR